MPNDLSAARRGRFGFFHLDYTLYTYTVFRSDKYLEKTDLVRVRLDKPVTLPGNDQHQTKTGCNLTVADRDSWCDWYNVRCLNLRSNRGWGAAAVTHNRHQPTALSR